MLGRFISFEGPDGSGKTSVLEQILPEIRKWTDKNVILTREPGGSEIAESVRHIILKPENTAMDSRTEALLYAASRRQHLAERVLPALNRGDWVITDRYVDSSIAYQGVARGIGIEEVYEMNQFATEGLMPELTLYLDVRAEVGLSRIERNRHVDEINRLDKEKLEFHQQVRQGYLQVLERFPERIVKINAENDIDTVSKECLEAILNHIRKEEETGL
ncbi:MAG: dTMP kinase [Atopococcus tabaci]|uniref:Thymidylate kinase n=1 Tax=Atopococcus tabaci TaxID=269774 RepID=A0AA43ZS44_9LACT|nr:dTMP kinase [Atopococcus tabaci]